MARLNYDSENLMVEKVMVKVKTRVNKERTPKHTTVRVTLPRVKPVR